ncbi:ATP-binding cassette domain-containing protein [Candidatus Venteria ishoeyi]|uniref:ABC transporter ATP-binding/permease protein n=1 Tax=Candidatus Venteria ishoeyi TaxID=1899563 RepID=A0A1H6F2S4_9GAMM|nr:ABC transporter ATP-binding protein [Candidatus Venteria ishoeyi]SEH04457.1 ABC transporter ATP-binding/permease protein [Candidatus Venteria ishoeyi]
MKAISIGKAPDNDCRIHHHSISDHHAVVDVLSGAEYLLRSRGSAPLVVARQSIARAQIDKFTPLQIGQIHITLGELLANPNFEPKNHLLACYDQTYTLVEGQIYLAGSSPVCDVALASPRLPWHAFRISVQKDDWQIKNGHRRLSFQTGQSWQIGPYHLEFTANQQLKVRTQGDETLTLHNAYTALPGNALLHSLHDVSLGFRSGEFIGIIGPSGAGKSTLLKTIRGLIPLHSGKITLSGHDLERNPQAYKALGMVPQDDVVIEELTVEENLMFAARLRLPPDWPREAQLAKVDALLEAMNLQAQRHQACTRISGGQRKRVNLALELLLEPTFLLADEVCSGLSARDSDNILKHLRRLADQGAGVLLTIHSPDIEALDLMDRLLVLDTGGYIAYYGPPLEAMGYFSRSQGISTCRSPKLIFDVLEKKKPGSDERAVTPQAHYEQFKNSRHYRDYIESVLERERS